MGSCTRHRRRPTRQPERALPPSPDAQVPAAPHRRRCTRGVHLAESAHASNGVRKELEFRIAEAGSGTTRTTGQIPLPDLENTHAQFSHIHFSTA